jgi:hypothetical protein
MSYLFAFKIGVGKKIANRISGALSDAFPINFSFFLLAVMALFSACRETPRHAVNFYCWRVEASIDSIEKLYFEELK